MRTFTALALCGVATAIRLSDTQTGAGGEDFLGDIADGLVAEGLMTREDANAWEANTCAMDLFDEIDTNSDDELSLEEGVDKILLEFPHLDGDDANTRQAIRDGIEKHLGHFDRDDSDTLDMNEVMGSDGEDDDFIGSLFEGLKDHDLLTDDEIAVWEARSSDEKKELGFEIFSMGDTDGSGGMCLDEGVAALRYYFPDSLGDADAVSDDVIKAELEAYLGHLDEDGSAELEFDEMLPEFQGDTFMRDLADGLVATGLMTREETAMVMMDVDTDDILQAF